MNMHIDAITWTDERIELLKTRWADGWSASLIAVELGGVSRNAVCGKVHRLKLAPRRERGLPQVHKPQNGGKAGGRKRRQGGLQNTTRLLAKANGHDPVYVEVPRIDDQQISAEQRRSVLELTADTCRWPVGDPSKPDFFFCGGQPKQHSPYCASHHAVAFVRSQPRPKRPWR